MSKDNLWSVFSSHFLMKKDGQQSQWVTSLNFYKGDLSCVDLETDWRFKEVKNKRSQSVFLGVCETSFPVQYPLLLLNGTIIEAGDYYSTDN